jgi:hypothetical protein
LATALLRATGESCGSDHGRCQWWPGGGVVADGGAVGGGSGDVELIDLGSVQLKGVADQVHVFGVSAEGHSWLDRLLVSAQTTAGNLPRLRDDGVGDLAALQARVSRLAQARLVTLTGSGGVGKTRAAIEIGWLSVDEFRLAQLDTT